ncbi:AMP-binding protein [Amycolatopsis sp. PS_44_ISF1]|uniref:non-ribosomal peptide synthetase n=1 Tax=Amycolatopsis sp. PS_44_ISF1 TaxID=2974917 RepID=UPI0028DFCA05|nr:AMP-binding protein [Amycolatopsis sp. PS_44_ISF1]MDT8913181.1 AMP-binding protein [Amycolatopsis sp. PS_44_ISF1]
MSEIGRMRDSRTAPGYPPLTPAEHALWYLDRLYPGSSLYHVPLAVLLTGPLDRAALTRSLTALAARHEAFRTTFPVREGKPYRHVARTASISLPLSVSTGDAFPALLDEWAREPFDLAGGPLWRTRLIRLGPEDHVLSLRLHHVICDGWSVRLLFEELGEGYSGAPPRPPLETPAAAEAVSESSLRWWSQTLDGVPAVLGLPPGARGSGPRSTASAVHRFRLAGGLVRTPPRTTPFVVLLAAYALVLGRATGRYDVVVGVPASTRSAPELEPLIGLFVTTVPVRIDLAGDPTFDVLVHRVRGALLAALDHQVPFDALVERLRLPRDPAGLPLVQATFGFEPGPPAGPELAGLTATALPAPLLPAKFDLDAVVSLAADGSGDLEAEFGYATDLLGAPEVRTLASRFAEVLRRARDPHRRLAELVDEPPAEAAEPARPTAVPVPELVLRQALSTPDAPAVAGRSGTSTYRELVAQAQALAGELRRHGVRPGEVVALSLARGPGVPAAVLGVLLAGAAYLPLDPRHTEAHAAELIERAGARLLLTDEGVKPLPGGGAARPGSAYVLFTSGSTGRPKGVVVGHAALANHAQAMRDRLGLRPGDRVLQFAGLAFDVAAEEIFPTLLAGACVVVCPDPPAPAEFTAVLRRLEITVANLPSGYWQRWAAGAPSVPSLRLLVVGSEPVDPGALAAWCRGPAVPVVNAYGLTETTITALTHRIAPDFAGRSVPVGTPLAGVVARVLDPELRQVPPGVEGELYIGGVALADGYLGAPALTAARFVPDPGRRGARLHRTGDRARRHEDGTVEVLGRADGQFKVDGYRIEPHQVEAALTAHAEVEQAAVTVHKGSDGTPRLCGYVVPRVPDDLRAQLAQRLPYHLIPASLTALPVLPLTASGKVDRGALPAPGPGRASAAAPPRTPWERKLVTLLRELLGTEEIGVHDNFFDLGGTSLTLATLHLRLDAPVALVAFYQHPTVAGLAAYLSGGREREAPPAPAAKAGLGRLAGLRRKQR